MHLWEEKICKKGKERVGKDSERRQAVWRGKESRDSQ